MNDDTRRDSRQIRLKPTLRLKTRSKFRIGQIMDHPRHDAARNVYPPAHSYHERYIACDGPQHGAEHVQRGNAHLAGSRGGGLRYLGCGSIRTRHFVNDPGSTIKILDPATGQHSFRRHVSISIAKIFNDRILSARRSRQRRVSAFGLNHDSSVGTSHKAGKTQPCARAQHGNRGTLNRLSSANREQIGGLKMRKCPSNRLEIVDNLDIGEAKSTSQLRPIDDPRAVCEHTTVANYGTGNSQHRARNSPVIPAHFEESSQGYLKFRIIGNQHRFDRSQLAGFQQRKTCVGTTNVSQQYSA